MIALRIAVAAAAISGVGIVLLSVLRTVVLPRATPARLARLAFVVVRDLLFLRLRLGRHEDYETRDRVLSLQAPLGLFAQLLLWGSCLFVCFAALSWAVADPHVTGTSIQAAFEQAGSAMLTLGFDKPHGVLAQFTAFGSAAVGVALVALVITYLPSVYNAFSRREAQITKLVVRAGAPPTGPSLLAASWHLERFDRLEEVWESWEDWFIELGETHTTFPQLGFFRSSHPENHWVLAAEAVLDGANMLGTTCDTTRQSRAELCLSAGVNALETIAKFLGVPLTPPDRAEEIALPRERWEAARAQLGELEIPLRGDIEHAWSEFRRVRQRYEPLLVVLGRMTDAPRSAWSCWRDDGPRHSPPLLRL